MKQPNEPSDDEDDEPTIEYLPEPQQEPPQQDSRLGLDVNELNKLGTEEEIDIPQQSPSAVNLKGSEEISLEYNGLRLNIGSSRQDITTLCNLAITIYYELKGIKPKENNGREYVG